MGSSGGGSGSSKVTTSTAPPPWLRKYVEQTAKEAKRLYESPLGTQFFPGPTYVPFSPQTEEALGLMESRARGGSALPGLAEDELSKTLRGEYLFSDPALSRQLGRLENRIGSRFAGGNRMGSGAFYNALADAQAGALAENYQQERARQFAGLSLAPSIYGFGYAPAQALGQVGAAREGLSAAQLEDAMRRFEFEQEAPFEKLDRYIAALYGGPGARFGVSTQRMPQQSGGFWQGAGTGLGALGTGYILGRQGQPAGTSTTNPDPFYLRFLSGLFGGGGG